MSSSGSGNESPIENVEDAGATAKSWLVATVAVTVISCVGLIAVVIVPALQRINYKYVLHFFVALAIGALSGDSMLHLLPHALFEAEAIGMRTRVLDYLRTKTTIDQEVLNKLDENTWTHVIETKNPLTKGIIALCGLLIFFLSQRAMIVYGDLTKDRKKKTKVGVEIEVTEENRNAASTPLVKTECEFGEGENNNTHLHKQNATPTIEVNANTNSRNQGEAINEAEKRSLLPSSASCNDRLSTTACDEHGCTTGNKRFSLRDPDSLLENRSTKDGRRASANVLLDSDGDDVETNDVALLTLHQLGTLPPRRSMQLEDRLDISTPLSRDNLASAFGVNDSDVEAISDHRHASHSHPRSPNESHKHGGNRHKNRLPSVSETQERGHKHDHGHDHGEHGHDHDEHGDGHDHDHEEGEEDGHGHGHGHSHKVPHDVRSLITMVILGDGLHNFTDGLAVGVAFAGSVAGGLSTAVAVFCHELPHELGDFAVLLKSGLTLKMALLFNMMSSILSFVGMVLGLLIGNNKSSTQWVYCIVAGIFLYIALVNMLPELNPSPGQRGLLKLSIVQLLGMLLGILVMFLIAFYEHDIKEADLFGINSSKGESEH